MEHSCEWNSTIYTVFVDFEQAFDSLHRKSLWKILCHYGISQKLVYIIQSLYENFECQVIHRNQLTEPIAVNNEVKQGCILSPVLFSLEIDWIMKNITQGKKQRLQWRLPSILEDLDYADDLGLLSSRHQNIQQKTELLSATANKIGFQVNTKKTQVVRVKTTNSNPVLINSKSIEDVEEFTFLSSKVTTTGDFNKEIDTRISMAKQAFAMLRPIWRSTELNIHTKFMIFNSNLLSSFCMNRSDGTPLWQLR